MDFSEAVDELLNGRKVCRRVWTPGNYLFIEGTNCGLKSINRYLNGAITPWPEYDSDNEAADWVVVDEREVV